MQRPDPRLLALVFVRHSKIADVSQRSNWRHAADAATAVPARFRPPGTLSSWMRSFVMKEQGQTGPPPGSVVCSTQRRFQEELDSWMPALDVDQRKAPTVFCRSSCLSHFVVVVDGSSVGILIDLRVQFFFSVGGRTEDSQVACSRWIFPWCP